MGKYSTQKARSRQQKRWGQILRRDISPVDMGPAMEHEYKAKRPPGKHGAFAATHTKAEGYAASSGLPSGALSQSRQIGGDFLLDYLRDDPTELSLCSLADSGVPTPTKPKEETASPEPVAASFELTGQAIPRVITHYLSLRHGFPLSFRNARFEFRPGRRLFSHRLIRFRPGIRKWRLLGFMGIARHVGWIRCWFFNFSQ